MKKMGYTWQEIVTMAQRRIQWRAFIDGPCSQRVDGHKYVSKLKYLERMIVTCGYDPPALRLEQVDRSLVSARRRQQGHVDDVIPRPQVT